MIGKVFSQWERSFVKKAEFGAGDKVSHRERRSIINSGHVVGIVII